MTVGELITELQRMNPHATVMHAAGEWGPTHITDVRSTVVIDSGDRVMNWEDYDHYPDWTPDAEDRPRLTVALIE